MPAPTGISTFYLSSRSAVASGGTGYVANDLVTLAGGTFTTAAQILITAVNAGVVTSFSVVGAGGVYSVVPPSPIATTGGSGTGLTLTGVWTPAIVQFAGIQLYRSLTAGALPTPGTLSEGEPFVNLATPAFMVGDALGNPIQLIGSIAPQNADAVAITGGSIDGTTLGLTTPAAAAVSTLRVSSFTRAGAIVSDVNGNLATDVMLPTAFGGTGLTSPTGYLRFNGVAAPTQNATIPNSDLTNSSITLGTTQINLGSSITSISGLASVSVTQSPTLPNQLATKGYVDSISVPGTGTVTSISMAVPTPFMVSPATITGAGTFAITYGTGQIPVANLGTGTPSATTVLLGNGTWGSFSSTAVQSFSAGTTGFTPSTATQGAITLAGTLVIANGGTGATTVAAAQNNLQVDPAGTALAFAIALG